MVKSVSGKEPKIAGSPREHDRTCLLIAGMHRSGTSALTRVLSLAGADLPQTLLQGSDANATSNPSGHWESKPAIGVGDLALNSAGTDWRDPEAVAATWYNSVKYTELRDQAIEVIAQEFDRSHLFVFKDPRICKLMPFWLDALDRSGVNARTVLVMRNPHEVAESLHARNGIDLALGRLLWLRYVLDSEIGSRGKTRHCLTYDQLLENPEKVVAGIGKAFDIAWPRQSTQSRLEIAKFVSVDQRHQKHDVPSEPDSHHGFAPLVAQVYGIFSRWAHEGESDSDYAALDIARVQLDQALDLLGEPVRLAIDHGSRLRHLRTRDKEREGQIKTASDRAEKAEAEREGLRQAIASLERERDQLARSGSEFGAVLEQTNERLGQVVLLRDELSAAIEAELGRNASVVASTLQFADDARKEAIAIQRTFDTRLDEERRRSDSLAAEIRAVEKAGREEAERMRAAFDEKLAEERLRAEHLAEEIRATEKAGWEEAERMRAAFDEKLAEERLRGNSLTTALAEKQRETDTALKRLDSTEKALEKANNAAKRLDEVLTQNAALSKLLKERTLLAEERQVAIEHLRSDRSRKIAERDQRYEKLRRRLDDLQVQLALARADHTGNPPEGPARRVGKWLRWPRSKAAKQQADRLELLRESGLFDPWWYLAKYEDVRAEGLDPAEHYLDLGGKEGRWPSPQFNGIWYLQNNPDVRESGANPLLHYIEHGAQEGRERRTLAETKQLEAIPGTGSSKRSTDNAETTEPAGQRTYAELAEITPESDGSAEPQGRPQHWKARKLPFRTLPDILARTGGGAISPDIPLGALTPPAERPKAAAAMAMYSAVGHFGTDWQGARSLPAVQDAIRFDLCEGELTLVDGWFASRNDLRIRLDAASSGSAKSIHVYQLGADGEVRRCGGVALANKGTILLQASLQNHFRPILLVVTDELDKVVDSRLMPFPSLWRHGTHFGEAVADLASGSSLVTIGRIEDQLLRQYLEIQGSGGHFALSSVSFDIIGANGTEAGLSNELLAWLCGDLGLKVETVGSIRAPEGEAAVAAQVAAVATCGAQRPDGAILKITANSVPTLQALFAPHDGLNNGIGGAVYLDAGEGLPAYRLRGGSLPDDAAAWRIASFDPLPHVAGGANVQSTEAIDLALIWPRPATQRPALVPLGAGAELPFAAPQRQAFSVLVDSRGKATNLTSLLVSLGEIAPDYDIDCVVLAEPAMKSEALAAIAAVGNLGFEINLNDAEHSRCLARFRGAVHLCKADKILLLNESVVLHDRRIASALVAASNMPGVGSTTALLVTLVSGSKGAESTHATAGWVAFGDGGSEPVLRQADLAEYSLPALLSNYAPDLRCAMVLREVLQVPIAGDDEAALADALHGMGLASLAITCVTAWADLPETASRSTMPFDGTRATLRVERLLR